MVLDQSFSFFYILRPGWVGAEVVHCVNRFYLYLFHIWQINRVVIMTFYLDEGNLFQNILACAN